MSSRVGEAEGVVEDIGVAVELLRVGGVGDKGVCTGKAAQTRHIIPRIHVD